ncbi:MAG: hypothetical protein ACYDBT_06315 [Desulfobulbaceae bacterium]
MSSIEINLKVRDLLRSEILRCVKELLETKHLYQSVRIETASVKEMLAEADKSPEVQAAVATSRACNTLGPIRSSSPPGTYVADFLKKYRQNIDNTLKIILDNFWTFSTEAYDHLVIASGGKVLESIRTSRSLLFLWHAHNAMRVCLPTIRDFMD